MSYHEINVFNWHQFNLTLVAAVLTQQMKFLFKEKNVTKVCCWFDCEHKGAPREKNLSSNSRLSQEFSQKTLQMGEMHKMNLFMNLKTFQGLSSIYDTAPE